MRNGRSCLGSDLPRGSAVSFGRQSKSDAEIRRRKGKTASGSSFRQGCRGWTPGLTLVPVFLVVEWHASVGYVQVESPGMGVPRDGLGRPEASNGSSPSPALVAHPESTSSSLRPRCPESSYHTPVNAASITELQLTGHVCDIGETCHLNLSCEEVSSLRTAMRKGEQE